MIHEVEPVGTLIRRIAADATRALSEVILESGVSAGTFEERLP